jgi:hypothetical protein
MRGRKVPIIFAAPRASDRSQDVDADYFTRHPGVTEYERDLIVGESPEPMPLGTRVIVRRVGQYERWRAFRVPNQPEMVN